MANFRYIAQDSRGEIRSGAASGSSSEEVAQLLQGQGLLILSIEDSTASASSKSLWTGQLFSRPVKGRDLIFLAEQLATLIQGGVPAVRAFSILGEHLENKILAHTIHQVAQEIAGGSALHRALAKHPDVFPALWISLVEAGELSGRLPEVLRQIGRYLQAQEEIKSKVATAMIYPLVLVTFSLFVLFFFVLKVVPTFAEVFESFDMQLPFLTRQIIGGSLWVQAHLWALAISTVSALIAFRLFSMSRKGKNFLSSWKLEIPIWRGFLRDILLERFLTTLSALTRSGVSILQGLAVLENLFEDNAVFQGAVHRAREAVARGVPLSAAFKDAEVFPGLVVEMLWMGEESGKLVDILDTLSHFYRERIDQFIRRFTSLIEPAMVLFVGAIVAVLVVSIFLPIFQISQIRA
ncbi:MAG: type II secretion system F family protein [Elusimicrobia bacterium]|nr:type II secretion system F family protein [Elusimicrobiota bacterium]